MNQDSRGSLTGCFGLGVSQKGSAGGHQQLQGHSGAGAAGRLSFSLTMGWRQTFLARGLSTGQSTAWQLAFPE